MSKIRICVDTASDIDLKTAQKYDIHLLPMTITMQQKEYKEAYDFMKFINIGFGNMVAANRVVTLVSPDSAPIKRLISDAREDGRVIDVSCGRRTRSVIVTDSDHVILSAIQTETIANRLDGDTSTTDDEEEDE